MKYKGKDTFDVELKFSREAAGIEFVRIKEADSSYPDFIDLERRQAVRVAKAILKKYEPEALK